MLIALRAITAARQILNVCVNILVCLFLLLLTACASGLPAKTQASPHASGKDEKGYQEAIIAAEQSGSDWKIVKSLRDMAEFYLDRRMYKEAEPFYLRGKKKAESTGPRAELAKILSGLAIVYKETGRYGDAEVHYRQAIEIDESISRALEAENPQLGTDLNNLAELYRVQGRYAEAEPLYQRAQSISERAGRNEDVAISLNNQAWLYVGQNRIEEAERLFEASIMRYKGTPNARPVNIAIAFDGLASLYARQHKYAEAELLFERAIAILEKDTTEATTSRLRIVLLHCLQSLAEVELVQGHNAEAKLSYQHALVIAEQTLGSQHPKVMEMRKYLEEKQL